MTPRNQFSSSILYRTLFLLILASRPSFGETRAPESCSPSLEEASAAFAQSQFDAAGQLFEAVSKDAENSAFIRGLATLGIAETDLAQKDQAAAMQAWMKLEKDLTLPGWQRAVAQRRIVETKRRSQGLPERDPMAYRVALPTLPKPATILHVSPKGNDAADGSQRKPFATLARARDAIRELRKSRGGALRKGGIVVMIGGGSYSPQEPFRLTAEDSGTDEAPIVYQAQSGSPAIFEGGLPVRGWKPIADAAMREKLDPSVREKVLEADLKANGITEWGDPTALKKRPELFVDGTPQTLARWPDGGFVKTGEILGQNTFKVWGSISGCRDGKFRFVEDRAKNWIDEPDLRLYGYWFWDWYEEYQQVSSIDAQQKSFTLAQPYSNYGYRAGQRYYAVNVFRELDQPGEWYLDRRSGKIYWLPPDQTAVSNADTVLSVYSEPFIILDGVQHVILLGLSFQDGRGDGIHINGGVDCLVAGCTLRRLGGDAITIEGGLHHGIFGCSMYALGSGAMRVNGGDRKTLTPGNHFVENCSVSDIARIKHTYAPAVHLDGCGNRIAHNLFERIPSSAMRIEGNDHLIELNQIHHVVQESDDQGGIDMFGNPLYRGVVIRWNRWSDIVGGTESGAAGIRLDDMISGIVLQGNVFERCGGVQFGGVQIHGGKDNVIDGNVFVDCLAALSFSRWDEARWLKAIEPLLQQAGAEPYASRYPDLSRLNVDPNVNFISRNLLFGCKNAFLRDGGVEKTALTMISPDSAPAELLTTGRWKDPRLRQVLFEPIPVAEMGPYLHSWRATSAVNN